MATKTRKPKAITAPLTRRERAILKEARAYGLNAFGYQREIPKKRGVTESLALMTDLERAQFFESLADFCALTWTLRGEN
jgi:hypothetical protein